LRLGAARRGIRGGPGGDVDDRAGCAGELPLFDEDAVLALEDEERLGGVVMDVASAGPKLAGSAASSSVERAPAVCSAVAFSVIAKLPRSIAGPRRVEG
jgi:hypothetical protein